MQSRSATLSKHQIHLLSESLGPTQTVMTAAVAKIHQKLSEEYSFKYAKLFGILCSIMDRTTNCLVLKMFHPITSEFIFKMRLKKSFISCYTCLNPCFLYFNYKNMAIGFSFADSDDLSNFEFVIGQLTKSIADNQGAIASSNLL